MFGRRERGARRLQRANLDARQVGAISTRRLVLFRIGAVLLGLLPLVLCELLMTLSHVAEPSHHVDPFVGFEGHQPLFVLSDDKQRYEIGEGRYLCFCPESFAAQKSPHEFRVFCLGGSTVQGRPYEIETSFTTWFELSLQAADPQQEFDVVNCGGVSYASYRLVPILREVLRYQPDLILLYTGHNEFLEDRTYQRVKQRSPIANAVLRGATRLRTFRWGWNQWNRWQTRSDPPLQVTALPVEVDARLDHAGGLDAYHRDSEWRDEIIRHFEFNLRRMISLCRAAEVPIWICDPVCNLRSTPPFKSQATNGLSPQQQAHVDQLREQASAQYATQLRAAVHSLELASAIDPQHAGLAYDLAKSYDALGAADKARASFIRAKDEDICPLRLIEPLRDVIRDVARDTDTPLIEVNSLFERHSRSGIPGGYLLVDHVHPSIRGHQMIAELLMQRAIDEGMVQADVAWLPRRDEAFARHSASLDDKYYLQAQRRLLGLRKWAAGRAGRID